MTERMTLIPAWPEFMRPATAAAMLDISTSSFRNLFPILAAYYKLEVIGLAGPKFRRENLLAVIGRLAERGADIRILKSSNIIEIGSDQYPIRSTRSGKSRRGRPRKEQTHNE